MKPTVTREEFDAIECNHCGYCCEHVWLPPPLKMGEIESNGGFPDNQRFIAWIADLEPTGRIGRWDDPESRHNTEFHCLRFARDENGIGMCLRYEERSDTCRGFPYGKPITKVRQCSWWVKVLPRKRRSRSNESA